MSKNTPEVYHQKMSTAFHTMIALPLAFFVYLFLEKRHNDLYPLVEKGIITYFIDYGLCLMALVLTFVAYRKFKNGLADIDKNSSLKSRFELYSSLVINVYLWIGLAFIILVLGLLLTTSVIFIVGYVILLFLLSLHRPTPDKYVKDLGLEGSEKKVVRNKEEFAD